MIKILVLALAWTIFGAIAYCVIVGRCFVKLLKLDPDLDRFEELSREVINLATFGIIPKDYKADELRKDFEKQSGIPYPLLILRDFALWPDTLAKVGPQLNEAVERIEWEYKQGLRTRKEKEVS